MEQARRVPQDVPKKSCAQTSKLRTTRHYGFMTVWDPCGIGSNTKVIFLSPRASPGRQMQRDHAIVMSRWREAYCRSLQVTTGPLLGFFKSSLKYEWVCDFLETRRVYRRIFSEENSPNEVQAVGEVGMGIQENSGGRRRTGGGRGKRGRCDKGGEQDK